MKKYIILLGAIRNVGGAQAYTANKLKYMEEKGWEPHAFFFVDGEITINYLLRFKNNYIPELQNEIKYSTAQQIANAVNRISSVVGHADEIVIESTILFLSFWGEYIAEKMNARHIVFILEEELRRITRREAAFFDFKLQRNELVFGSQRRLLQLFRFYYHLKYRKYHQSLLPFCSNVVDYAPAKIPDELLCSHSYKILTIGRLLKPYIKPMFKAIKSFAEKYPQKRFSLIVIGGDADGNLENETKELFCHLTNIDVHMMGYVYPIPYDLIKIADVAIASSNSVLVSANEGIPTIVVDAYDFKAIGIYGITTNNLLHRTHEPKTPIVDLLDDVLNKKEYPKVLSQHHEQQDLSIYFEPHVKFLEEASKEKAYYNLSKMYTPFFFFRQRLKEKIKRLFRPFYVPVINQFYRYFRSPEEE